MNIVLNEMDSSNCRNESIDISMNGHALAKLSRDKSEKKDCFIELKSKGRYNEANTYRLSEQNIGRFLELLYDISEPDIIDTLEKNVYVLPFAGKHFEALIEKLKDLGKMITKK